MMPVFVSWTDQTPYRYSLICATSSVTWFNKMVLVKQYEPTVFSSCSTCSVYHSKAFSHADVSRPCHPIGLDTFYLSSVWILSLTGKNAKSRAFRSYGAVTRNEERVRLRWEFPCSLPCVFSFMYLQSGSTLPNQPCNPFEYVASHQVRQVILFDYVLQSLRDKIEQNSRVFKTGSGQGLPGISAVKPFIFKHQRRFTSIKALNGIEF